MNANWTKYLPTFIRVRVDGRYGLQKVLGNIGWLSGDKILRMGLGLAVSVWLARYLGPEQFGLYSYILAFVALFGPIASLGIDTLVVRDIVRDPAAKDEILGTAFVAKLVGGAVALVSALTVVFMLRPAEDQMHWFIAIIAAGMLFQGFDVADLWFQAKVQSKYSVLARNAAFIVAAVLKVGLILGAAPLVFFLWASLVEVVIGAIGLATVIRWQGQSMSRWRFRAHRCNDLVKNGWPLLLSGLAVVGYMRLDIVMLGELADDGAVGIYSAATRISEIWYFIPMSFVVSVFPYIVAAKKVNESTYINKLAQLYSLLAWAAITVALLVSIFVEPIVTSLFGEPYRPAAAVLRIHVWAGIAVFLGVASSQYLITENLTKISFYRTFIGLLVNVLLNFVLIPPYGAKGAATATLLSYCVATFSLVFFKPTRRQSKLLIQSLNVARLRNLALLAARPDAQD